MPFIGKGLLFLSETHLAIMLMAVLLLYLTTEISERAKGCPYLEALLYSLFPRPADPAIVRQHFFFCFAFHYVAYNCTFVFPFLSKNRLPPLSMCRNLTHPSVSHLNVSASKSPPIFSVWAITPFSEGITHPSSVVLPTACLMLLCLCTFLLSFSTRLTASAGQRIPCGPHGI